MNLIRLALITIIAILLWSGLKLLVRIYKIIVAVRGVTNGHFNTHSNEQDTKKQNLTHKTMVKCSKCQLYILDSDAISYQGKPYCCPEHAQLNNN